jgi:hypothetical protein
MRFVIAVALWMACDRTPEPPPVVSNDGVRLISLGREPQRVLRYHVTKGATSTLSLAMDLEITAGGRGGKYPTMVMELAITVDDVLANGDAKLTTVVRDVRVRERAGSVVALDAFSTLLSQLRGITYTAVLTPDGVTRDVHISPVSAGIEGQIDQLTNNLEQLVVRLPVVPVGVGATWTTRTVSAGAAFPMTTVTTTELTAIDGERIGLATRSTITAPDVQSPAGSYKDVGGAGTGKGTVDLTTPAMRGELTSELRGTLTAEGLTQPMQMGLTLKIE